MEDFSHPGAAQILANLGITLKNGDGHVYMTDCKPGTDQLEIWQRSREETFCFNVTGAGGFISMEIPRVYSIRGNSYNVTAVMTVEGTSTSFPLKKNLWTPVGDTADPQKRDHALLEIRASK
ncbi:hypothetical protein OG401_41460 [Kitasatospora purpeofusca]|uniref:hypothetical protein n=1 Tax=Kitasatospora purpeofusca TaxID=67352 RepID=UPI002254B3D4|nr:hypothetical protein [Kitasatospora purpeofusca]MCX4690690.1 hypothetical protein [Kitasatospora purpeofusca]